MGKAEKDEERFLFPYLRLRFVFQAGRRRITLHCGCSASSHWDTCSDMTEEHSLNISNILLCTLPVHLYVWSFVGLVVGLWKHFARVWFSFTQTHNGGQVMVVSQHAFCLWMKPWAGASLRACQGGWRFPHLSLSDLMWRRASWAWSSLRGWFSLCPGARGCVSCLRLEDQTSSQLTHQLNHVMEHEIHSEKYLHLLLKIHLQGM